MKDKKRIKRILKLIEKIWNIYPQQRFGQMLTNYAFYPLMHENEIWNAEDDSIESKLKNLLHSIRLQEQQRKLRERKKANKGDKHAKSKKRIKQARRQTKHR